MDEKVYYQMFEKKTASLIATACELGAITTSENEADHEALKTFGMNLGIAFQIKDDLFDLLGNQSETGKDLAKDVMSNMITLPIVHSMNTVDKQTVRQIGKLLRKVKKSKKVTNDLKQIIEETGGFDYAKSKIFEYSEKALDAINKYPETIYKHKLVDLVNYNGNRSK